MVVALIIYINKCIHASSQIILALNYLTGVSEGKKTQENQVPLTQKEGKILHCSERRGIYKGIGWHDCNGVQR